MLLSPLNKKEPSVWLKKNIKKICVGFGIGKVGMLIFFIFFFLILQALFRCSNVGRYVGNQLALVSVIGVNSAHVSTEGPTFFSSFFRGGCLFLPVLQGTDKRNLKAFPFLSLSLFFLFFSFSLSFLRRPVPGMKRCLERVWIWAIQIPFSLIEKVLSRATENGTA